MKERCFEVIKYAFAGAIAIGILSCGSKQDKNQPDAVGNLGNAPIVAEKVLAGNDTVIVVDVSAADRSPVSLKLSDLADDIEIVRLENNNEAFVGEGATWLTGNRIIIYSNGIVRQFDRSGKYLGKIGNKGQGPGEYAIAPYDIYMDESAGRIYLAQYGATKLFEYDSDGSFIKDIPLAYKLEKGRINVDAAKETVTVAAMPFSESDHLENVWVQDFQGNVKSSDTKPWLAVVPDYSSEIKAGTPSAANGFDYSIFSITPRQDSLYVYKDGSLHPAFTAKMDGSVEEVPMHDYVSTPSLYALILFSQPKAVSENSYIIPAMTPLVVDRKSLRGGFANLMLDNIGSVEINGNWLQESTPEYFVMTFDPGVLADKIEAASQEHEDLDASVIESMNKFKTTIDPDDNNYIVIGKWKK